MERLSEFLKDYKNNSLIRHIGFSMATVGMLAGMVAVGVAIAVESGPLGAIAAGVTLLSFLLFPMTDLRYPRRRGW